MVSISNPARLSADIYRFNHAPWEAIRKQNVLIWLAWTCFNIAYDEAVANPKWSEFLQESLGMLEARTGTKFPDGFNVDVQMMRLTLDPVNVRVSESVITSAHSWQAKGRPLLIYALSNAINWWLREVVYPYQGMGLVSASPNE